MFNQNPPLQRIPPPEQQPMSESSLEEGETGSVQAEDWGSEYNQIIAMYGRATSDKALRTKKIKKKLRQIKEIEEYEAALRKMRSCRDRHFHNPFARQVLQTRPMLLLKTQSVERALAEDHDTDAVLRSLGLKNQRMLFKGGTHANLAYVVMYLKEGVIAGWLMDRHRDLMLTDRQCLAHNVRGLLRSMSSLRSTCLLGTGYQSNPPTQAETPLQ